jgi:ABC-type uncharacterized transport system substrate-binding protein
MATKRLADKVECLLVLCLLLFNGSSHAALPSIAVFLSETGRPHLEVLETLRTELGLSANIVLINGQEAVPKGTVLAISVGVKATETLARSGQPVPVLATLVPRVSFESLSGSAHGQDRSKYSAVFLDIPPRRQLALLHQVFPERRHLALLTGSASESQVAQFTTAAQELGMSILAARVHSESEIYPALQRLLPETDLLLALPDPSVYNSHTIQDILLTTYRFRVPMVGFSPAYTKAGALLSMYATPAQIARQAADMARAVLAGHALAAAQYARDMEIATNPHVARSLDIALESEAALRDRLRQLEDRP